MVILIGIKIIGVVTFEWTKYIRPYAVTLKNGKMEKNLQFRFQA